MSAEAVVWHDAECGGYGEDLAVWHDLAARADGPVLDLGCGTGRVALALGERGHEMWALDRDPALAGELATRAAARGLEVQVVVGDCRALRLGRAFALAIAPMQLMQILGGAAGRRALLEGVREHLEPGGLFAAAIVEGLPAAALASGEDAIPDVREDSGWVYSSRPLGAIVREDGLEVRRLRELISPSGELREHVHVDLLDLLDAEGLEAEGRACGLRPTGRVAIAGGEAHVGSTAVIFERSG